MEADDGTMAAEDVLIRRVDSMLDMFARGRSILTHPFLITTTWARTASPFLDGLAKHISHFSPPLSCVASSLPRTPWRSSLPWCPLRLVLVLCEGALFIILWYIATYPTSPNG